MVTASGRLNAGKVLCIAGDSRATWCAILPDGAPEGEWVRSDIAEHVRGEHSTYSWLLEPMIERSGFRIDSADYSDDGFLADYIATAV